MVSLIINIYSDSGFWGLIKRLIKKIGRECNIIFYQIGDSLSTTYSKDFVFNFLTQEFQVNPTTKVEGCIPRPVLTNYLNHKFDLLGSGWVEIKYGMQCKGLGKYKYEKKPPTHIDRDGLWLKSRINSSNLTESREIWKLIDEDYKPIDWQIDFKSGFRWSEKTYSKRIKFAVLPGVDVKVPWELARMQHLPQMAISYAFDDLFDDDKIRIKGEFRNQILDFIATNPPRYGVNWVCAMDVAIRAANWVLAIQLFHSVGDIFDQEFCRIFQRSIYEHGKFIINNLEWYDGKRGNHYLSNICGLVFISSYLPPTEIHNSWLAFSIQQLITEVDFQFFADGGNFEYSTAYHRLSTEMIFFSTALLMGLPDERLKQLQNFKPGVFRSGLGKPNLKLAPLNLFTYNDELASDKKILFSTLYFQRLEKFVDFIDIISKPGNVLPQIGDNDSGRFFKLHPKYKILSLSEIEAYYFDLAGNSQTGIGDVYYLEDHLDCNSSMVIASAIFRQRSFLSLINLKEKIEQSTDYLITKALLSKKNALKINDWDSEWMQISSFVGSEELFDEYLREKEPIPQSKKHTSKFKLNEKIEDLQLFCFNDFGLFLFKANFFYLSVRCNTHLFPHTSTGHMHEDQLGIELSIDNVDIIRDPGSYIYTSLPWERNVYRSSNSHYSPFYTSNENISDCNVFKQINVSPAKIKYFGHRGIIVESVATDQSCGLLVEMLEDTLNIHFLNFSGGIKKDLISVPFSPGYGIKMK
jgi:hypothetical protein